jgi:hypothetical protein
VKATSRTVHLDILADVVEEHSQVEVARDWEWPDARTALTEGIALVSGVFFIEVPISLWNCEIERKFWNSIEKQVKLRV